MKVGHFGLVRNPGVQHDQFGAAGSGEFDHVVDRRPRVLARVVAEKYDAFCIDVVGHREPAIGQPVDRCCVPRTERHAACPVRTPQQVHESAIHAVGRLGIPSGSRHRQGFWAIAFDQPREAFCDLVEGLLVGNFFPVVGTPLTHALQRRSQTIGMIVDLWCGHTFEADVGRQKGIGMGQNPLELPVLLMTAHLAADIANRANHVGH